MAGSDIDTLKLELKRLMEQKTALEADIKERTDRLNAPGQPGLKGGLMDKEGFPRSDIDVHAVRMDRNRIICLTNDHKKLMAEIEAGMHKLHAAARASKGVEAAAGAGAAAAAGDVKGHDDKRPRLDDAGAGADARQPSSVLAAPSPADAGAVPAAAPVAGVGRPFAVVDEVAEDSPASTAGIRIGDQLCRFGPITETEGGGRLAAVAEVLQQHEGLPVAAVVLRAGQPLELQLVPRIWEGRGLLGCHLRPLA